MTGGGQKPKSCTECPKLREEIDELKSTQKKLLEQITRLEAKTDNLTKNGNGNDRPPAGGPSAKEIGGIVAKEIGGIVEEEFEKQRCRKALVISGLPEQTDEKSDGEKVAEILVKTGVDPGQIVGVYRMGGEIEGRNEAAAAVPRRPRLLKVKLYSGHWRNEVLQKARNLKNDPNFRGVYVNPSRTFKQRMEIKEKMAEVNQRRAEGENVYLNYSRMEVVASTRPMLDNQGNVRRGGHR